MDFEFLLKKSLDHYLAHTGGQTPPLLAESIQYSVVGSGKRIRPRILLACAEMLELPPSWATDPAIALELIHCFSLIHDDLPCMDNDDFRRGKPSNHKKFGETTALLAGDALMALAVEVFLSSPADLPGLLAGLKRLIGAVGPRGMIGGQAAEVLLNKDSTLDDLRRIHHQKTGALFEAAVLIPKDLKNISDKSSQGEALNTFARQLGLAFQIADDLEDVSTDSSGEISSDPTNVLFYISQDDARNTSIAQLEAGVEKICSIWNEKAVPLKAIAAEVIAKLNSTRSIQVHEKT